MIHIAHGPSDPRYADLIDEMFRQRAAAFGERRGWRVTVENDRERDRFDDLHPLYVLSVGENGELRASLRLLPTTGPHMLSDVFPEVMGDEQIVRDPLVWESSRFNVNTKLFSRTSTHLVTVVTGELLAGLFEIAEVAGLKWIVSVYDVAVERVLRRTGCSFSRIGIPHRYDRELTVAGLFEVGTDVVTKLRDRADLTGEILDCEVRQNITQIA